MKKVISIILISLIILTSGCDKIQLSKDKKPSFTREPYPRVDGSTATIPLSGAIACGLLELSKEGQKIPEEAGYVPMEVK